ncbi:MAG: FAD-dependent monooxygenase [Boseongicola sp.]|nr:FAD-dependent monooxygenase [Boseongicola sp.]
MNRTDVDIFISGGGIAGLTAAAAFAHQGLSVVLADPSVPPANLDTSGSDLRSTAFLAPARELLENIGLWESVERNAEPLNTLRVIDCQGQPPAPRTDRAFQSTDLGAPSFGWNLPNWLTRKVLSETLAKSPNVDLRLGTGFAGLVTREREAIVTLTSGEQIRARLAVAADGRTSPLREAAGIASKTTRYGQKALAFIVAHQKPHENISTELYLTGGAFTTVPLPDHNGQHCSAIVWMNDGAVAVRLNNLDDVAFAAAATERSCGVLGQMTLISPKNVWPIVTQEAEHLISERVALIAEAAHVLPPIGAQGLNTSLRDVAILAELSQTAKDGLGTREFLAAYVKARSKDIRRRAQFIDLYNRICRSDLPPIQDLRSAGLRVVHDLAPLRRKVMTAGMGR